MKAIGVGYYEVSIIRHADCLLYQSTIFITGNKIICVSLCCFYLQMHNKFKIKASVLKMSQDINTIYAHTNQTANVQTAQMFYFFSQATAWSSLHSYNPQNSVTFSFFFFFWRTVSCCVFVLHRPHKTQFKHRETTV